MGLHGSYATPACATILLLHLAAGLAVAAEAGSSRVLRGRIVDDKGRGVDGAEVTTCRDVGRDPVVVNRDTPICATELGRVLSNATGSFTLRWKGNTPLGPDSAVVIHRSGYFTAVVAAERLRATAPLSVKLSPAPSVLKLRALGTGGKPIAGAEYGWFSEDGRALRVRHVRCCTNGLGEMNLAESELPAGPITVFAIQPDPPRRFGLVKVDTRIPTRDVRAIELSQDLMTLQGGVVGSDGAPISALVDAEPLDPRATDTFDRVLLAIRPRETDGSGRFEIRSSSKLRVRLHLATWTPGVGTRTAHVQSRAIGEADATVQRDGSTITLRAPASPIVSCQVADRRGSPLAIERLGIQFGPHIGWAHSGACVEVRASPDAPKGTELPYTVRFIWPEGARIVTISADARVAAKAPGAADRTLAAAIVLDGAKQPCRMIVQESDARQ